MGDEQYVWDMILPKLVGLFRADFGDRKVGLNTRQRVATLFAMRALRRYVAVNSLFKEGLYLESHPLVRAGYEDWLYLAYLLREPGHSRCDAFQEAINKLDARVYDAFRALCGQAVTDRYFRVPPAIVAKFVGLPRSQTQALSFARMADDVELRRVHNFVYTYLSGLSHPDARLHYIFELSESVVARIPKRDPKRGIRLALWFTWFTSRILVLASNEFGNDHEPFVEEYLIPLVTCKGVNIETCVFVREYGKA